MSSVMLTTLLQITRETSQYDSPQYFAICKRNVPGEIHIAAHRMQVYTSSCLAASAKWTGISKMVNGESEFSELVKHKLIVNPPAVIIVNPPLPQYLNTKLSYDTVQCTEQMAWIPARQAGRYRVNKLYLIRKRVLVDDVEFFPRALAKYPFLENN
jgi:hypothetical protein